MQCKTMRGNENKMQGIDYIINQRFTHCNRNKYKQLRYAHIYSKYEVKSHMLSAAQGIVKW